ncbi:hypothetical protein Bhyg_16903 [Pseudolycoriella hygida]|uniref:Uncharacterized protein n=1 Tax=Pseudolycoriella hygida TaxID=35572 RepID=A0A9Q0MLB8_9DIPT|nr:hypothetical protein Bhyg_16903 [Pseudolycoriella hygida]
MLSILATLIIGLSGVLVFFVDESHTAFGFSFVSLICSCAITLHSDYWKDDADKLGRLKFYCIASILFICFHLGMASSRLAKYCEDGYRFAIITTVNCVISLLFLIYSIICTMTTLKKAKEQTISINNQPLV